MVWLSSLCMLGSRTLASWLGSGSNNSLEEYIDWSGWREKVIWFPSISYCVGCVWLERLNIVLWVMHKKLIVTVGIIVVFVHLRDILLCYFVLDMDAIGIDWKICMIQIGWDLRWEWNLIVWLCNFKSQSVQFTR